MFGSSDHSWPRRTRIANSGYQVTLPKSLFVVTFVQQKPRKIIASRLIEIHNRSQGGWQRRLGLH